MLSVGQLMGSLRILGITFEMAQIVSQGFWNLKRSCSGLPEKQVALSCMGGNKLDGSDLGEWVSGQP